jgi:UDP:flavonoid glycosyltransferase YjiC (YdhE family)
MNISIFSIGTQGDVRPFIALGLGLQAAGHKVCIASGKTCEALIVNHGLDYAPLTADFFRTYGQGSPCPSARIESLSLDEYCSQTS